MKKYLNQDMGKEIERVKEQYQERMSVLYKNINKLEAFICLKKNYDISLKNDAKQPISEESSTSSES